MTDNRSAPSGPRTEAIVDTLADVRDFSYHPPLVVFLRSGGSFARYDHTSEVDDGVNTIVVGDYVYLRRADLRATLTSGATVQASGIVAGAGTVLEAVGNVVTMKAGPVSDMWGRSYFVNQDQANPDPTKRTGSLSLPFHTIQEAVNAAEVQGWAFVTIVVAPSLLDYPGNIVINGTVLSQCTTICGLANLDLSYTEPWISGSISVNTGSHDPNNCPVIQLIGLFIAPANADPTIPLTPTDAAQAISVSVTSCPTQLDVSGFATAIVQLERSSIHRVSSADTRMFFDGESWGFAVQNGSTFLPANYHRFFNALGADTVDANLGIVGLVIGATQIVDIAAPLIRSNEWTIPTIVGGAADISVVHHHTTDGHSFVAVANLSRVGGTINDTVRILCMHGIQPTPVVT